MAKDQWFMDRAELGTSLLPVMQIQWQPKTICMIVILLGMICVLPEFEGQQILDMIIKPDKWSAENGYEIRLEVYDISCAIKTYERLGFKEMCEMQF